MNLRTRNFESFVAAARDRNALWRIILTCVFMLVLYAVLSALVLAGLGTVLGLLTSLSMAPFEARAILSGDTPEKLMVILASFIPMAIVVFLAALSHGQRPATLFGVAPNFWIHFALCALVIAAVNSLGYVALLITSQTDSLTPNMDPLPWARHLLWAIPLLFVQTSSEELLFRGYLQQRLGARFKSFIWWMILPSILFGMLHYNGELTPRLAITIVGITTFFGLIAADLTRVTGNLGAAMGMHFANNFFALFLVGVPGQLSGLALYHTSTGLHDGEAALGLYLYDVIFLSIIWIIARRVLR